MSNILHSTVYRACIRTLINMYMFVTNVMCLRLAHVQTTMCGIQDFVVKMIGESTSESKLKDRKRVNHRDSTYVFVT
jgi:hypothetical protein